jgi:hypothetical protein
MPLFEVGRRRTIGKSEIPPDVSALAQTQPPVGAQSRRMRYFFHLEDGACIRDPTGEEFPDDAAALREAVTVARELSKLRVHAYEWSVVVKNADGLRVGSVPLLPAPIAYAQSVPPPRSIQ